MDRDIQQKKLGLRIKLRRIELGLTQEELAARLGNKSRASVCTVENGKEDLTTTRIQQYADALECSPSYLMGWTESGGMTNRERILIDAYHKADDRTRRMILYMLGVNKELTDGESKKAE